MYVFLAVRIICTRQVVANCGPGFNVDCTDNVRVADSLLVHRNCETRRFSADVSLDRTFLHHFHASAAGSWLVASVQFRSHISSDSLSLSRVSRASAARIGSSQRELSA